MGKRTKKKSKEIPFEVNGKKYYFDYEDFKKQADFERKVKHG